MGVSSASTPVTSAAATSTDVPELGQAIHDLAGHQIDLDEFTRRFLGSRVYTLCPVRPGPFVMSLPGGAAIVPIWSTVRALRQVTGNYDWLAQPGGDLAARLPAGVGVLIDDGLPCPIALSPAVLLGHRCGA